MLELKGEYSSCIIYNDNVELTAMSQIYTLLNNKAFIGSKIRIMPDVHAGSGCVIGFTSTLTDKIISNLVGVDIGCGVYSVCTGRKNIDFKMLDKVIRKYVPSGHNVHTSQSDGDWIKKDFKKTPMYDDIQKICKRQNQDFDRVVASLGSLGSGNHFCEVDKDQEGLLWLTIHSGSRNFGLKIANYWQSIAKAKTHGTEGTMNGLEYLEDEDYKGYLSDMMIAQIYAHKNRSCMMEQILSHMDLVYGDGRSVESVHNYIDLDHKIIRKGAISARKNEPVIIPWNMRDGLIIGVGKGNDDWNQSAPHGAGRIMGRQVAKKSLRLEDFEDSMKGIWTSCVNKDTIDESPMAYKPFQEIQDLIGDTVEITNRLIPVYNFKSGE
jgi:tRNA-splicing ligase RtcB